MRRLCLLAAALALAGCTFFGHRHPAPQVHAVLGPPYQADGAWHYPRAQYDLDETGLAVVTARRSGLTADGELADPTALAAAHPSLQLPAIARITNLDTGLQVLVRVNDRGPVPLGRTIALTPRAFALLGGAGGIMPVRIQVLEAESRQLTAQLGGADAPPLQIATAAPAGVASESLAPPSGATQEATRPLAAAPAPQQAAPAVAHATIPLRLPEQVWRVPVRPVALYVELGTFSRPEYAELLRQRMAWLGAQTSTDYEAPREGAFRVRIGPLPSVAAADAVLTRALQAGDADAHILVD